MTYVTINGKRLCRKSYGDEKTNLRLEGKAYAYYSFTDPCNIYEYVEEVEVAEDEWENAYSYNILPDHPNMMTEEELIAYLEEEYDALKKEEDEDNA